MRRTLRAAVLVTALTGTAALACAPPDTPTPKVAGQVRYLCDEIHMPGNEDGWCVDWTRPNGMQVTGPAARQVFEQNNPDVG